MKKFILSAIVAVASLIAPTSVFAQDPVLYTSDKLGISIAVPENSQVQSEGADHLVLTTADNQFCVSLIPFDVKNASEDDITKAFVTLGEAAKLDTEHMESQDINSETLEGTYRMSPLGEGATCVGIAGSEATGKGFLVTVTAGKDYIGYIIASLKLFNLVK